MKAEGSNGGDDSTLYIGFNGVFSDDDPLDGFTKWNDFKDIVPSDETDSVEDCEDAATGLTLTTIIGAVTLLPSLNAVLTRMDPAKDSGCNKCTAAVPSVFGAISTIAALSTFKSECYDSFPSKITSSGIKIADLTPSLGVGFYFELVVAILGIVTGLIMTCIAVPDHKQVETAEPGSKLELADNL